MPIRPLFGGHYADSAEKCLAERDGSYKVFLRQGASGFRIALSGRLSPTETSNPSKVTQLALAAIQRNKEHTKPLAEILFVRANNTIAIINLDRMVLEKSSNTWLAVPRKVVRPGSSQSYVLCKERLFEITPSASETRNEIKLGFKPTDAAALHPTKGRIAYLSQINGGTNVVISDFDGGNEVNIGFGYDPSFSFDGEKLLYTTANDELGWHIAIYENGETRRIKIPEHPAVNIHPCISPDNKLIAFSMKGEDGTMQIGIADADGSNVRQLTHVGEFNSQASFSPDGNYLAFMRKKPKDAPADAYASIVIENVATGEETVVATDALESGPVWRKLPDSE